MCNCHHNQIYHPYPLVITPHLPSPLAIPCQPLIYFLSLQVCLFWTCHINGIIWYIFLWLTFSTMHKISKVYSWCRMVFCLISFYGWIILHCMRIPHLFIHMLIDGHLGCFRIWGIMSSAVINTDGQVSVWVCVLICLGYIPRSGIAGSYGNCVFNCLRICQTIFQSICTLYIPTSWVWELQRIIQIYMSSNALHSTPTVPGNLVLFE